MIELTADDYAWAVTTARRACRRMGVQWHEDLAHEAQVALWSAARRYDASRGVTLRAYARRRVVGALRPRAAGDSRRGAARWQLTVLDAPDAEGRTLAERVPHHDGDPAKLVADSEAARRLLARLRPRDRRIVEMRARGLTLDEIGKRLGVTRQAVDERLARLRRAGASPHARMNGRT